MKLKLNIILYNALIAATLTSCSDSNTPMPDDDASGGNAAICVSVDSYGRGIGSRASSGEENCWDGDDAENKGWNENTVSTLDIYLLDGQGKITAAIQEAITTKTHDCNNPHKILTIEELLTKPGFSISSIKESAYIVGIANIPPSITGDAVIGKILKEVYIELENNAYNTRRGGFVMTGFYKIPADFSPKNDITISLKRVAAKIRLTLVNADRSSTIPAGEFYSDLCHYVTKAILTPENELPEKNGIAFDGASLYTTQTPVSGSWSYPDDLTEEHTAVRDNGHVYYTYPNDWVDYSKITNQCRKAGSGAHKDHVKTGGDRYEVGNYDDKAPIVDSRETYLIVKAPFTNPDNGSKKYYFYKVPVNYRLAEINDHQCFSEDEIVTKILPLYRTERNHFYDIKAVIDRAGADTPSEAVSLPRFTLSIAPMTDGGTYDYIY